MRKHEAIKMLTAFLEGAPDDADFQFQIDEPQHELGYDLSRRREIFRTGQQMKIFASYQTGWMLSEEAREMFSGHSRA